VLSHLLAVRKGEDVMSTMTGNMRRTILTGIAGALVAVGALGTARADVTSDKPGAILIFPKIVVDTNGVLGPPTDTIVQVTNTSNSVIAARCFLVNTTSHCSNAPDTACTPQTVATRCPTGGVCVPGWVENDFQMTLTKRQPVSWNASQGLATFPCDGVTNINCPNGQTNRGSNGSPSSVPPAQEDPFVGELKCVEVDPADFLPSTHGGLDPANNLGGDLKGEATIVSAVDGTVDARKYNGLGIQAIRDANNRDNILQIGGPGAEYNGCPNILILDNLFDDAVISTSNASSRVRTDLTVIPCSEDFLNQEHNLGGATLQFLVFNEFEQRFSTSTGFIGFRETPLSDIDTRPGPFGDPQSIFNVGVEGTLSGQIRIRAVASSSRGNGVLGVAESSWNCSNGPGGVCSTAVNLHYTGNRDLPDFLVLSPEQ